MAIFEGFPFYQCIVWVGTIMTRDISALQSLLQNYWGFYGQASRYSANLGISKMDLPGCLREKVDEWLGRTEPAPAVKKRGTSFPKHVKEVDAVHTGPHTNTLRGERLMTFDFVWIATFPGSFRKFCCWGGSKIQLPHVYISEHL